MKFKVDENLPGEVAELFRSAGQDAATAQAEGLAGHRDTLLAEACRKEQRILVTLDLDFANLKTYPPKDYPGFLVLRVSRQDKRHVLSVIKRCLPLLEKEDLKNRLWIAEETRVRIRDGNG